MTAQQLPLFPPEGKTGQVWQEGNHWIATIDGGWYMAYGKTQQEAIKRVKENYHRIPEAYEHEN
jgi:hypothetical protein